MRHNVHGRLVPSAVTLSLLLPLIGACSNGPPAATTAGTSTTAGSITSTSTSSGGTGTTTGANSTGGTATTTSGSTGSGSTTTGTGSTTGMPDAGCDCPAGKHCDPAGSGACLDCLTDSDCTSPLVCQSSSSYLQYGKCVQCSEAEPTCPAGQVCDLSLGGSYHQCVTRCSFDGGMVPPCPPNSLGQPQHCSPVSNTCGPGCLSNVDCTAPLLCTDAGTCVGCITPLDCPYSNPGCDDGECGFCVAQSNCPPGLTCDPYGVCSCADGGVCGGNAPVCNGYTCQCFTTADCASRDQICALTGACVPPCNDGGTQCRWDQYCYADGGNCGPCEDDSQCTGFDAGPHCIASTNPYCGCNDSTDCGALGVCGPGSVCILSCLLDGGTDCSMLFQEFCDPTTGQCGPCTLDSQCVGDMYGSICLNGTCGCQVQSDCAGGQVCTNNSCYPSCVDGGTDCSLGYYTYCDPATGLCSPCTNDQECVGNDAGPRCLAQSTATCGCRNAADCIAPTVCSSASQTCVPSCVDGGTTCPGYFPVCDSSSGQCVQCLADTDCSTNYPSYPLCLNDIDAGTSCVQCLTNTDCPASTPFCDSHFYDYACVASCVLSDGGTYCPFGVCDLSTTLCVGCLSDSDCYTNAPRCTSDVDAGNFCVQCLTASDCGDAGPCASQSFQCGYCSIDADCPPEVPICASSSCTDGGF